VNASPPGGAAWPPTGRQTIALTARLVADIGPGATRALCDALGPVAERTSGLAA
jgi:hypothetical protein